MTRHRPFVQVDVFSSAPYCGNPLAVVVDGTDISDDAMAQFARWTNLSETTFLLPPTDPAADYRVRIFTPGGELPFAGHPTLGSAHAWLDAGGAPRDPDVIVQQCGAGLVRVRRDGSRLAFAAPPMIKTGALEAHELDVFTRALGIDPATVLDHQWVDNGPGWAVLRLPSAADVLALEPDLAQIPDAMIGAIGPYPAGSEHDFEMRTFAPGVGVPEDPVCGSMNAGVGQWLLGSGHVSQSYTVSQGTRLARAGEIAVVPDGDTVWVGGASTVCIRGDVLL
ncbi:PhzF family phenazine biosynthesis protein [Microbacterium sp. W1N]|uniref:PhzF family phenazine biosynthesis protein n=1 Tax=Microbacterium festucae TaxID=2977531 RepID=UPI0021C15E87|nr:PhzF family phenazine biosynthesis protein [Microbacterium festucae]MCT9819854.1 PhzF family phenazine biosynthesis protein [Microbacterium festucae]